MILLRSIILFCFLFFTMYSCSGSFNRADVGGRVTSTQLIDSASIIRSKDYMELGVSSGESSVFFLFGLIPVTNPLNMDYALSEAVQKIPGGKSLIKVKYWQETHLFFPVGTISVLKVKGTVIGSPSPVTPNEAGKR